MKAKAVFTLLLAMLLSLCVCAGGFAQALTEDEMEEQSDDVRILVYDGRAMFVYPDFTEYQETMVEQVNMLVRLLPEDLRLYLMIPPRRISLETNELRELSGDEVKAAQYVFRHIDPGIEYVDAYYALSQYLSSGSLNDIYFQTDHHWTPLGAYLAAEAFLISAGIEYHPLSEYVQRDDGEFKGYLLLLTAAEELSGKRDRMIYYQLPGTEGRTAVVYRPKTATREASEEEVLLVDPARYGYAVCVGSFGFSHAIIQGDDTRERALLVVGGSSCYAVCPFLADHFKTVILIEPRRYSGGKQELDEMIMEYGITDVLLMPSYTISFLTLR